MDEETTAQPAAENAGVPAWLSPLVRIDRGVAGVEKAGAGAMCALVFILITGNVVVRALRIPVYWIDEVAIYAMVWMTFLASSYAVFSREHVAVSLLAERLPKASRRAAAAVVDGVLVLLGAGLLALAWVWFDPAGLLAAGGDTQVFAQTTLKFIYSEPTASFAAPKVLFWLIVPVFCLGVLFHALVRLFVSLFGAGGQT